MQTTCTMFTKEDMDAIVSSKQRGIKTDEGELHVGFWNSDHRFFIKTESEMRLQINGGGTT